MHGSEPQYMSSDSEGDGMLSDSEDADDVNGTGLDFLLRWGVEQKPHELPVLLLPDPIVYLIWHGRWQHLVFDRSWHQGVVGYAGGPLFTQLDWPPAQSSFWTDGDEGHAAPQPFEPTLAPENLDRISRYIREWVDVILANARDAAHRQQLEDQLRTEIAHSQCVGAQQMHTILSHPASSGVVLSHASDVIWSHLVSSSRS